MLWKNTKFCQDSCKSRINVRKLMIATMLLVVLASGAAVFAGSHLPNPLITVNASGLLSTYSTAGGIDLSNPFFQSFGTNGRSCVSCHQPGDAWTITPPHIQARFYSSAGNDPIFRPNDGANCPSADVSTFEARKSTYSLPLTKGLVRVSLSVQLGADFTIRDIKDHYARPETTNAQPAMYRRPLP